MGSRRTLPKGTAHVFAALDTDLTKDVRQIAQIARYVRRELVREVDIATPGAMGHRSR
jgi:hypothetical protein